MASRCCGVGEGGFNLSISICGTNYVLIPRIGKLKPPTFPRQLSRMKEIV
jgi:hypothetical protein